MRRFVLLSAAALLLCGCSDPDRLIASDDGKIIHYISKKSVDPVKHTAIYVMSNRETRISMKSLIRYDCENVRYKPLSFEMINENNNESVNLSGSEVEKASRWIDTHPGTVGRAVVVKACFPFSA